MKNRANFIGSNLFAFFMIMFFYYGCNEKQVDMISGTYELEGIQVNETYCLIGCLPEYEGEIMNSDTVETKFTIEIVLVERRQDSLLFTGLEGADETVKHVSYTGSTNRSDCTQYTNPRDCAYAKIEDNKIIFDLLSPFGRYTGEGMLNDRELILETNFYYRGLSVDYKLSGRKVVH